MIKASHLFHRAGGNAIDLGCGVGNETIFLLKAGWDVWAIDKEPRAIKIIQHRKEIGDCKKPTSQQASFEDISTWKSLPDADLICASYTLPFCHPIHFDKVWNQVEAKIKPDGRFAGHFFGPHYLGFTSREMEKMTFLSKEEILSLFQNFDIEYFQETEEDGQSSTGQTIHSHIFEVIARKR